MRQEQSFVKKVATITALVVAVGAVLSSFISLYRTIYPASEQKIDMAYELLRQKIEYMDNVIFIMRSDMLEMREIMGVAYQEKKSAQCKSENPPSPASPVIPAVQSVDTDSDKMLEMPVRLMKDIPVGLKMERFTTGGSAKDAGDVALPANLDMMM